MCRVKDCERKNHARDLCSMHYKRWIRTGNPEVKTVPNYKGDDAGYLAIHDRLRKQRGYPTQFNCIDCKARAQEWSYNHSGIEERVNYIDGRYLRFSTDLKQFDPRCCSCHRKFDLSAASSIG